MAPPRHSALAHTLPGAERRILGGVRAIKPKPERDKYAHQHYL
jgi:hypothetical protein